MLAVVERHLPGPFKRSGTTNIITKCPFHKGGQERKPSFSINLEKGLFHCFTGDCGLSGDLDRLLRLLKLGPTQIEAELKSVRPVLEQNRQLHRIEKAHAFIDRDPFKAPFAFPESILGVFEFSPGLLIEQGFNPTILKQQEIGYDISANRIMYPIRDLYGSLAGFSGGITPLTEKYRDEKYRVYQGKRQNHLGQWLQSDYGAWFDDWFREWFDISSTEYRFENRNYLWGFHEVWERWCNDPGSVDKIYVVEGYKARLWMLQAGFQNTVALQGSYISDLQQQALHRTGSHIVLCLDNDSAGRGATLKIADYLWRPMYGRISVIQYPQEDLDSGVDTQPDGYEIESLIWMVNNARGYFDHINFLRRRQ